MSTRRAGGVGGGGVGPGGCGGEVAQKSCGCGCRGELGREAGREAWDEGAGEVARSPFLEVEPFLVEPPPLAEPFLKDPLREGLPNRTKEPMPPGSPMPSLAVRRSSISLEGDRFT